MHRPMHRIVIRSANESSGPRSFGLEELLTALGAPAVQSWWRCARLWYESRDNRDVAELDRAERSHTLLSGKQLLRAARRVREIIDGEFQAVREGEDRPWLVLRAFDSSWWEVVSDDWSTVAAIRSALAIDEQAAIGTI